MRAFHHCINEATRVFVSLNVGFRRDDGRSRDGTTTEPPLFAAAVASCRCFPSRLLLLLLCLLRVSLSLSTGGVIARWRQMPRGLRVGRRRGSSSRPGSGELQSQWFWSNKDKGEKRSLLFLALPAKSVGLKELELQMSVYSSARKKVRKGLAKSELGGFKSTILSELCFHRSAYHHSSRSKKAISVQSLSAVSRNYFALSLSSRETLFKKESVNTHAH